MKQKEILLFGATGQIGRNLIRKLSQNNYKITAVTRNIHRPGYILKTQANPGYLNLVVNLSSTEYTIEGLRIIDFSKLFLIFFSPSNLLFA